MSATVSCVIVNYNGRELLADCLGSLRRQSRAPDEIVLVDNASTDGSLRLVRERFSDQVRVVASPENLGFAAGCNRGWRESNGELVAFLNNDIVLDPDWLARLLEHDTPRWGSWASLIVFHDSGLVDSAGDGMAVIGAGYKIGHGEPPGGHLRERPVFGPCGAAALYRRRLLEETGGFDEDFFLVHEDSDLNLRAQLLGHRCLFVPAARVRHRVNTSIGTFSETYVYYGHRNSEAVFWKNMPPTLLLLYLPERILFDLAALLYFLRRRRGRAFARAKLDFLRSLPAVWRKRREVQRGRKLSARQLRGLLDRNWLRYRRKGPRR